MVVVVWLSRRRFLRRTTFSFGIIGAAVVDAFLERRIDVDVFASSIAVLEGSPSGSGRFGLRWSFGRHRMRAVVAVVASYAIANCL